MKLNFKNIGKLTSANIDINTITLIAGLNSTGKSTVGKLLYCLFNSFYDFKENASATLKSFIRNQFYEITYSITFLDECVEELFNLRLRATKELVENILKRFIDEKSLKNNKIVLERIASILNLSDDEIYKQILQVKFSSEFGNQIQNIFVEEKESAISLHIGDNKIALEIKDNKISCLKNFLELNTEAIYIDDPFVLDTLMQRKIYHSFEVNHKYHLQKKLSEKLWADSPVGEAIQTLLTTKQLENIYSRIDSVCSGNIISNKASAFFQYNNKKAELNVLNLSTGLKTFSIIKTLLMNGSLKQGGVLILDEPEIHLHPEWQKTLAEIIVLIQIEFNIHILINSHSPYFIKAIDVYSKKYKIRETCKFYLSEDDKTYKTARIKDVSDSLEGIYRLLFIPLQELEDERAEIEAGDF